MAASSVALGTIRFANDAPFVLIGGVNVLESRDFALEVAGHYKTVCAELGIPLVFKASYDKANRTSLGGKRGLGMDEGLKVMQSVKDSIGCPVLTDIHAPEHCATVAATCDIMQIPAFLCRQTDLLVAAAKTDCAINVKKGQFLSPQEMTFVTNKLKEDGANEIWQTERGTTFGYQNLVVDMRSFNIMAENGYPTIMDATHSVQLPGAAGGISGGQREFVPALARAALAAGANGVFLETHPNPEKAISDAASQVPLNELPALIESLLRVWQAVR